MQCLIHEKTKQTGVLAQGIYQHFSLTNTISCGPKEVKRGNQLIRHPTAAVSILTCDHIMGLVIVPPDCSA